MSYNRLDDVAIIGDGIGTHVMGYDNYGRLISNDGPLASDTQTYAYDELQRIKAQTVEGAANGGVRSLTYAYDALGRLASLNANMTGLTTYSYDGNTDRLRVLTHPNGTRSDLRYDAVGRLQHVFNGANGDPLYNRYSSVYDARDVKINTQWRTDNTKPIATTQYSYDALDQLKQERVTGGAAGTAYTSHYNYDAMGNRTQVDRTSYAANGSSSVATTTSVPNSLNQLSSLTTTLSNGPTTSANLIYDTAGNLQWAKNNDGTSTAYFYDDADRLNRIERRNTKGETIQVSEFFYDYASRRARSREWLLTGGTTWVETEDKNRVFDGMDVIQERYASNNYILAEIVRDGNIGGILSRTTTAGVAFYGYDGNGNVTLLTNSAGQDVGHYRYDAFGNTLEAEGPRAGENPYRFSTKELHGPSGLYDYGFRFYSPGLGRWMNRDPIEEQGGINLYSIVGNNPINNVDEYGYIEVSKKFGKGKKNFIDRAINGLLVPAVNTKASKDAFSKAGANTKKLQYIFDNLTVVPGSVKSSKGKQSGTHGGMQKIGKKFVFTYVVDDPYKKNGATKTAGTIAGDILHDIVHAVFQENGEEYTPVRLEEDYTSPYSGRTWPKGTYIDKRWEDWAEYVRQQSGL